MYATHTRTHTHTHTHTHIYIYIHIYTTHTYIHTHIYTHIYIHTYTCILFSSRYPTHFHTSGIRPQASGQPLGASRDCTAKIATILLIYSKGITLCHSNTLAFDNGIKRSERYTYTALDPITPNISVPHISPVPLSDIPIPLLIL